MSVYPLYTVKAVIRPRVGNLGKLVQPGVLLAIRVEGDDIGFDGEGDWRRERDLNSRGTGPRDFQSRALPGYAISARANPHAPLV